MGDLRVPALGELGREQVSRQVIERVDDLSVSKEPKMQVRSRVADPRPTHLAEPLARFYPIAGLDVVACQMSVERDDAIAVIHLDEQTTRSHVASVHETRAPGLQRNERFALPVDAREDDSAGSDRANRLPIFGCEIDPTVKALSVIARLSEAAGDDARIPIERAHQSHVAEPVLPRSVRLCVAVQ